MEIKQTIKSILLV